jgi:cytochrome c oxidase subunit 1
MHYLGVLGMPRRYYNFEGYEFIPPSAHVLNAVISVAAFVIATGQLLFVFNLVWSTFRGKVAGPNPWRAASLEWFTPETPPGHGNWGKELPIVYRWAYDYSVPGAPQDFIAQDDRWAYAYAVPGAAEDFIAQNAPPEHGGTEPEPPVVAPETQEAPT